MATQESQAYRIYLHMRGPTSAEGITRNLVLENVPKPKPQEGQLLVRMKAVALNYRDLLVATDDERYLVRTIAPLVPCADGCGIIEEVNFAPGHASRRKVGDHVLIAANTTWKSAEPGTAGDLDGSQMLGAGDVQGLLRQYIVTDEDGVIPAPNSLTFEQGAAVVAAYGTAWNALFGSQMPLRPGDVIVTQGTGGVSTAALQIAVAAGARVIALSSSKEKRVTLRQLGAVYTLDSTDPDWSSKVRNFTSGRGADHVVDVVGATSISQSLRAVRNGGLVSAVGFLSDSQEHDLLPEIIFGAKTVRGLVYASIPMLADMSAFLQKHNIKPVIGQIFDWENAKEAFLALLDFKQAGKIVVKVR